MPKLFDLLSEGSRKDLKDVKKIVVPKIEKKENCSDPKTSEKRAAEKKPFTPVIEIPDFVAFDVETTGLEFRVDRIIEIGAVKFIKGKPTDEFTTLINPGVTIPPHITDLTGIRNEDIAGAPSFPDVAQKFLDFLGELPLCGHQIEFDLTFLNDELKRAARNGVQCQLIDTALLSRILLQPSLRYSLKFVSESLGVDLDNAHRALHDARASGDVAVKLIPKITHLPFHVRQTMAACVPGSLLKGWLYKSLGNARPAIILNNTRNMLHNSRLSHPDSFSEIERSDIDTIFSDKGALSSILTAFTPRESQKEMALQVTDAFNTQSILVAEAGTGTGKSLAYLVPAAHWAQKNNCRVIISTKTRNLQDQLIQNDLPIVSKTADTKVRYTVLKGRQNYVCLHRWEKLLFGEAGSLSPRERFAILPLIPWVERTETGDIEEQNQFNPKWYSKIWNLISAESHECGGRRCRFYQNCFLQNARQRALNSHIVIINHALFFSDFCSESSFLGKIGSIIFDEAHHLESSGHRFLRVEFDTNRSNLFIETVNNLVLKVGDFKENKAMQTIYEHGKAIKSMLKNLRKRSQDLLAELASWAKNKGGEKEYQIAYHENDLGNLLEPKAFTIILTELIDLLHFMKQAVIGNPDRENLEGLEADVQTCSERASQLRADIQYLVAAFTEEHVFWIEGNHEKGWTKLCGVPLDVGGLLSEIWEKCSGAVVFTSATLSISKSSDYFKRGVGLVAHESRTAIGTFKSPFSASQAIYSAMSTAPDPDSPQFPAFVADMIKSVHLQFEKNILVLFTANTMLGSVHDILKKDSQVDLNKLLAQGASGTRNTILEQFKQNQRMILLGTDSFWEGVDVPGEACEVVIMPRLPFPVPTHPLTQALCKRMEEKNGESFFTYSIPEAVIKFRQGVGRLIRTATDRGALIVLDHRIVTKGYGKQFTRSVDGEFMKFESKDALLNTIQDFFENKIETSDLSELKYVPIDEV
jgi:predicted DnaQ family exonuclease/DinG family helicase